MPAIPGVVYLPPSRLQHQTSTRFRGELATRACQEKHLSIREFQRVLEQDTDTYIKTPPPDLLKTLGLSQNEFFEQMDQLADLLMHNSAYSQGTWVVDLETTQLTKKKWQCFRKPDAQVLLQYVGAGALGKVFRLSIGDRDYALKVTEVVGLEAIKNYAHADYLGVSNVPRFYCGNAELSNRPAWLLTEFVDKNTPTRPGKTLREHGFYILDDLAKNRVGKFIVDLDFMARRYS